MKNITISLLVGLSVFAIIYLLGCFYSVSFNIRSWSEGCRSLVAFMGGILFLALGGATYGTLSEETN